MENQTRIIVRDIEKEMKSAYLDYSMSVLVGRALPDVRDGLKPVHRRILYTLFENGIFPDKPFRKCADTVGSVLGRYHPHGDASVYDALVRLAQDFSLRYMLIDGHGNFGSVDGDPAAAYRYTEARMSKTAMLMVEDIDKETVDFMPNYDDRLKEPTVLPSKIPNLLVNGSVGIAVGMATNIPPHNLKEVIGAICLLIDKPEAELDEIMEYIKGPDFPTGGIIMGRSGIRAAYATGRGKITVRSKTEIEELDNGKFRIVVTEIPYAVNKANLIKQIAELHKEKRVDGIVLLRDESGRDGLRIVIELRRDVNPQVVLNQLFSYTQLQDTFGAIMIALSDGVPRELTLKEMLQQYIDFQGEVVTRKTQFNLKKAKEREHILEGLKIALDFIDEVIKILRASKTVQEGKDALIERFGLDDIQANAIVAMRLAQLTGLERSKIENELQEILKKIAEYEEILGDYSKVLEIVKNGLIEISDKFGDERRTEIQAVSGEVDIEDLIPEENSIITMTHFGYIKRQPVSTYKLQHRGGRGVNGMATREEDFVEDLITTSTHDLVLFITNKGRMFKLKGYEIPESSKNTKGTNIINLLPLEAEEHVASMIKTKSMTDSGYIVMITKNGIIKRTELSAYKNIRASGINAINLDEGDELAFTALTDGEKELIVATRRGMAIRFKEEDARPLGRVSRGVKAITLKADDLVVGAAVISEDATILTVTDKGFGRRSDFSEYRLQSRGGLGIKNYSMDKDKGLVAAVRPVTENDDVVMIATNGVIIRINANDVSKQSRYGGGVRVMRTEGEDRVVTASVVPHEDQEEAPAEETTENN
ncbi:MAG: DNA gyrase subunit A [Oscillospiraceae bacterium]|nr:DNA gyrase subunit A [Oscillospiraceae bacterium]